MTTAPPFCEPRDIGRAARPRPKSRPLPAGCDCPRSAGTGVGHSGGRALCIIARAPVTTDRKPSAGSSNTSPGVAAPPGRRRAQGHLKKPARDSTWRTPDFGRRRRVSRRLTSIDVLHAVKAARFSLISSRRALQRRAAGGGAASCVHASLSIQPAIVSGTGSLPCAQRRTRRSSQYRISANPRCDQCNRVRHSQND